jgi:DNA-binding response OmpR family regulator
MRVAVVDDDPQVRDLIEELLSERGYAVDCFDSAESAWQRLLRYRPHLLILDVGLPAEDGLDLLRRLRSLHGPDSYPVLIVSGRDKEEDIVKGYEAGASEYLTKPFSQEELLAKCSVLIARSKSGEATVEVGLGVASRGDTLLQRYDVKGLLGRGAFGVVYHAVDLQNNGLEVALKVCDEEQARNPENRFRFLRESYSLASLDHPSIVRVSDFGLLEDCLFLSMNYVPGPTLTKMIKSSGPLSESDTKAMLLALGGALEALERASLIHRDIKPDNIVVREGDCRRPVLVDFGLAKRNAERSVTAKSSIVGTPGYMPPELFLGEEADARSDLFSLGLVARFALTGQVLFPHLRGVALLMRIARGALPIPATKDAALGKALSWMLESERERRVPSARALLDLLGSKEEK